MKSKLASFGFLIAATLLSGAVTGKTRIFITESQELQLSGKAAVGDAKSGVSVAGGASSQSIEVMKAFSRRCPAVVVTENRDKADFVVRLDHAEPNPTSLFVHGNKVAVFNKNDDLIYSTSTRTLTSAVKSACEAIGGSSTK